MIKTITRTYLRHSRDNGQRTIYVEFTDERGKASCLECGAEAAAKSLHMQAVLIRAAREGIKLEKETW
jgi:hypothetical protein